jgi:hypothetical protein
MPPSDPIERLGLSVPYGWWPSAAHLYQAAIATVAPPLLPAPVY